MERVAEVYRAERGWRQHGRRHARRQRPAGLLGAAPGRVESLFTGLQNVIPTHLLDRELVDFSAIRATGTPVPDGDTAFDVE